MSLAQPAHNENGALPQAALPRRISQLQH